jgi:CBS domain containing-hemolysin-like protein
MEDILEEIFGEINDEFDEEEKFDSRINDNTFVFEAKTLINDMCKVMEIETDTFDQIRNEADTVGGMLLEVSGDLPDQGEEIVISGFTFIVEAVDKRRIKRIKIIRNGGQNA